MSMPHEVQSKYHQSPGQRCEKSGHGITHQETNCRQLNTPWKAKRAKTILSPIAKRGWDQRPRFHREVTWLDLDCLKYWKCRRRYPWLSRIGGVRRRWKARIGWWMRKWLLKVCGFNGDDQNAECNFLRLPWKEQLTRNWFTSSIALPQGWGRSWARRTAPRRTKSTLQS